MILELNDLVKRYGQQLVLDCVNMEIKEGEVLGLLGPNGAGKTTCIHSILGLIPIDSGTITIFDQKLKKDSKHIKQKIGYVTQEVTIFEELTAYDNLAFFGGIYGLKGEELKTNIADALSIVGLTDHQKKFPQKFSGGMKRRLNIACALVHKPTFIIMDEPTVGIDAQSRNYILETIRKLNKQGTTVLYTTHYIEEVQAIASRVVILDQGHVIAEGTKEELIANMQHEEKITIELVESKTINLDGILAIPGVKEAEQIEKKVNIISAVNAGNFEQIVDETKKQGSIKSMNSETPSLEDVFLTLTGKNLRDGGES